MRECAGLNIKESEITSSELGWDCRKSTVESSTLSGEYALLRAENLKMKSSQLFGKYSFQYVRGGELDACRLDTKDAFWHAESVYVKNSYIKGEYLGWYSKNLTLENCVIIGTQPFCYAKGLKLINCEMHECDLSFEKSSVNATVLTDVLSIKNPYKGKISCVGVGEIIRDDKKSKCKIIVQGEKK